MQVPVTPGLAATDPSALQGPGETNLLMALADMHKNGRVPVAAPKLPKNLGTGKPTKPGRNR